VLLRSSTHIGRWPRSNRLVQILAVLGLVPLGLAPADSGYPPQSGSAPLRIMPSSVVVVLGETAMLDVVDETGKPVPGASWALSAPIGELAAGGDSVELRPRSVGTTTLTASAGTRSATATIHVVEGKELTATTVLWSVEPLPGYEALFLRQASPNADGPDFFDVEWAPDSPGIVRALRSDGRQIWMAHLTSVASPSTLKRKALPAFGKTISQDGLQEDVVDLLLGDGGGFFESRSSPAARASSSSSRGQSMLVHDSGDGSGGLLLLERGASHDDLVDLGLKGTEAWRYHSAGRLVDSWTVNQEEDIGIVEILPAGPASSLLVLNGNTGEVRFRIPIPNSSTTISGLKCEEGSFLTNTRPSRTGAPFTSEGGNIYLQVAVHTEAEIAACPKGSYSFDNTLSLLEVFPTGEANWRTIARSHADGAGAYQAQPRVFAGETIPDGLGGVLAAWTYFSPGSKDGEKAHPEARLSRLSPSGQTDFTLPMPGWDANPAAFFDENMVLGERNVLYATDGKLLVQFHVAKGELKWVRQPPSGKLKLVFATGGGGVLVTNFGEVFYFDAEGNGAKVPWSVAIGGNGSGVGLKQTDLFEHAPTDPIPLRELQLFSAGRFLGVEAGAPLGRGGVLMFLVR